MPMKTLVTALTALSLTSCNSLPNQSAERAEYTFLRKYSDLALEQFHLQYLGLTTPPGENINCFGARFMTRELHTLDQARTLVKSSAKIFIQEANKNEKLKKYFKDEIFDIDQLDYYVSFWDENTDRPPKPYVALATVKDGKITYYFKRDDSEFLDDNANIVEDY